MKLDPSCYILAPKYMTCFCKSADSRWYGNCDYWKFPGAWLFGKLASYLGANIQV